jgi:hypothetical protein
MLERGKQRILPTPYTSAVLRRSRERLKRHARKSGEGDLYLSETCRGSRFYVQAVCNSLSITHALSHTTSQAMLSGGGDLADAICQCSASKVKGTVKFLVGG